MIQIKNLHKKYGTHKVLDGINMQFEKGKVYGIVGENGAGKTTFFNCIAQLLDYEGTIEAPFSPLKDYIGYLPTDLYFFPMITGKEYLRFILNARGVAPIDFQEKNIFELPLENYVSGYSTGMKKKLAINALLLIPNAVIILDEPFNGVDIHSNMTISALINIWKQQGKTILLSSHIFATLDICDELFLLENGSMGKPIFKDSFKELEAKMHQKYNDKLLKMI